MSKALNSTGRPIVYSMCNWGVDGPWNFAPTISNYRRTPGNLINFVSSNHLYKQSNREKKRKIYQRKKEVGNGSLTDNESISVSRQL